MFGKLDKKKDKNMIKLIECDLKDYWIVIYLKVVVKKIIVVDK